MSKKQPAFELAVAELDRSSETQWPKEFSGSILVSTPH